MLKNLFCFVLSLLLSCCFMKINKIEFINWFLLTVHYKIHGVFRVPVHHALILPIILTVEISEGKGHFSSIADRGTVDGYPAVCEVGEQTARVYLVECPVVVSDFNRLPVL